MSEAVATAVEGFMLRGAEEKDVPLILSLIKELAAYESLLDQVEATEETLMDSLFQRKVAEAVIGEYHGTPVGYILFFYNFSTFTGKPGIYLEDLYVKPELRRKGMGKAMLSYLAKLSIDRDCSRFEWACLDWNTPSIGFYKSLGAVPMDQWTVYRLTGKEREKLAEQ